MAWDEWEQLKADARGRAGEASQHTRLNSVPDGGGAAPAAVVPPLQTDPTGKKAAVTALEQTIRPDTDTAGDRAQEPSGSTVRTFSGWATADGLADAHQEWQRQVKNLKDRLANDQSALARANDEFHYVDTGVMTEIAQVAPGRAARREA
ncbi:hypothetical protein [Streptomyces sp. VRA16 Mangrove soil]|uniref:hypothetical protein n=1 Tax=Streptomyces sp. VRA16 Mangrove soil TaxID=2817434 RepID=UPI001A9D93F0|nr:hypothetical protein [Streptomyces sp. VRA16 Mangrove soil]MBO1334128.1 hypothetical protein [Streptomyces sp. VRA16 Mangrove soil]